ncbi:hypothetical protein [Thermococcus sp. JdF3]|uniref:hypothetical protein n=1 Tax=Thermococcus sp. JdF3 TaxID=1638258 RepID=UPI00143A2BB3|nr:hypothetical protein [Thermococcus sp. JdF3]NJE02359.1 hypothetical protein [Thermococcus sp. JdF3]
MDSLRTKLGIVLDFKELKKSNVKFIGIVTKPTPGGRYYTVYYIVEGPGIDPQREVRELQKISEGVKRTDIEILSGRSKLSPLSLQVSYDWNPIGSVHWKRSALDSAPRAYLEFKADYSYVTTTSGQYWYLVHTVTQGRAMASTVAVKSLETIIDANHPQNPWQQIEDWCPKNNGGPKTGYSYTFQINNVKKGSVSATVSYETSDGYYMKWKDRTSGYESRLDVIHEYYKQHYLRPDIAWGSQLTVEPSAIFSADPSKGMGRTYYLSLDHVVKGTFWVRGGSGAIYTMNTPPIKFHVTVYPWKIVEYNQ